MATSYNNDRLCLCMVQKQACEFMYGYSPTHTVWFVVPGPCVMCELHHNADSPKRSNPPSRKL